MKCKYLGINNRVLFYISYHGPKDDRNICIKHSPCRNLLGLIGQEDINIDNFESIPESVISFKGNLNFID